MKEDATCILKFKKIQCYPNGADYMLVSRLGWCSICSIDTALIARVTMSCTDSRLLSIGIKMRDLMGYDFEPYFQNIDFTTELLYSDTAFGVYGKNGVIYEKLDFETLLLHVYENGKEDVLQLQTETSNGGDIYSHLERPDEWDVVPNVYDAYVDPIR